MKPHSQRFWFRVMLWLLLIVAEIVIGILMFLYYSLYIHH